MTLAQAGERRLRRRRWRRRARGVDAPTRNSAVLRNNLAVLLELRGRHRRAPSRCCKQAFAADPALPQVSKNTGDLLYRAGRYDEAFEAYERAAKLAPELGDDLYFKLGNIAYKRRDAARARDCWTRATELNPGHQLARANLDMLGAERVTVHGGCRRFDALAHGPRRCAPACTLDAYKPKCLAPPDRGADARLRRAHVRRVPRGAREHTPGEVERLHDALTINVTRFFRNPETWDGGGGERAAGAAGAARRRCAPGAPAAPRARRRTRSPCSGPMRRSGGAPGLARPASRSRPPTSTASACSGRGRGSTAATRSWRRRRAWCERWTRPEGEVTRASIARLRARVQVSTLDLTRDPLPVRQVRPRGVPQRRDLLRPRDAGAALRGLPRRARARAAP